MIGELAPREEPGIRLVELAERHAADFAERAARHDRENSFVSENFDAMRASRFLAGTTPRDYGGFGLESLHDIAVAVSRLARGCPATALAANMHLGSAWVLARSARGESLEQRESRQLTAMLMMLGRCRLVMAHAGTEPGTGIMFPSTEACPVDGGYRINGHKTFTTNSAIADVITVFLRVPGADGVPRSGTAMVRRGTPGMRVEPTWDALGMRATGSHDVVFTDCVVPAEAVRLRGPLGVLAAEEWVGVLAVNFPMLGTYLGIAEAAFDRAGQIAATKHRMPSGQLLAERPGTQFQIAEMRVILSGARAVLARTGMMMDEWLRSWGPLPPLPEMNELVSEFQCAKLIVNRAAVELVDRAMTLVGGQSYRACDPLSRLYRDARAGGFMQPFAPSEAAEFIGRVSLGLDPYAELRAREVFPAPTVAGS